MPFALDEPQAPAELLVEVVLSDAQRAANPELEVLRCSVSKSCVRDSNLWRVNSGR